MTLEAVEHEATAMVQQTGSGEDADSAPTILILLRCDDNTVCVGRCASVVLLGRVKGVEALM